MHILEIHSFGEYSTESRSNSTFQLNLLSSDQIFSLKLSRNSQELKSKVCVIRKTLQTPAFMGEIWEKGGVSGHMANGIWFCNCLKEKGLLNPLL